MAIRTEQGRPGMPERARQPTEQAHSENGAAPDELYGLVSVLYHALQGSETYAKYCDDAQNAGDEELVEFFEECRVEEDDRARKAKMLLADRLEGIDEDDEMADEDDEDDETADEDEADETVSEDDEDEDDETVDEDEESASSDEDDED